MPPIRSDPFQADQVRAGDSCELENGHPIEYLPGGGRHSKANRSGGLALAEASGGFGEQQDLSAWRADNV
jgi:hypothetical protein